MRLNSSFNPINLNINLLNLFDTNSLLSFRRQLNDSTSRDDCPLQDRIDFLHVSPAALSFPGTLNIFHICFHSGRPGMPVCQRYRLESVICNHHVTLLTPSLSTPPPHPFSDTCFYYRIKVHILTLSSILATISWIIVNNKQCCCTGNLSIHILREGLSYCVISD